MSRATPQMRDFAKRLIACETRINKSAEIKNPVGLPVPEKLRTQLATVMGTGGFNALLARALVLASAEVPRFSAIQVKADGSLAGVEEVRAQLSPSAFFEGRVVLLAQLLGLLVAFIGETMTVRLVREVWPKAPLNGLELGKGVQYEKVN